MSTSAAIGKLLENGTVKAIRCNFDGYLGERKGDPGVGRILFENYGENELDALLKHKEIRSLDADLENVEIYPPNKNPLPVKRFKSLDDYFWDGKGDMGADYVYVFKDGEWFVKFFDSITDIPGCSALKGQDWIRLADVME